MRTTRMLHGPGNLVYGVAGVLERAGFDVALVDYDHRPFDVDSYRKCPNVTAVVLDGNTHVYTTHAQQDRGHNGSESTTKIPAPCAEAAGLGKHDVPESSPASPDDELPF